MLKRILMLLPVVIALVACDSSREEESAVNLITVTADENGSAEADLKAAAKGQSVTLTAKPANGYEFAGWVVLSGNMTLENPLENPLTFTMPGTAVSLKATFRMEEQDVYPLSVTSSDDSKGTVNWVSFSSSDMDGSTGVEKPKEVPESYIVRLSAERKTGYRFKGWNITGDVQLQAMNPSGDEEEDQNADIKPDVYFYMPAGEVRITGEFEEAVNKVEVVQSEGGTIEVTGVQGGMLQEGKLFTCKAVPADGYKFITWSLEGVTLNEDSFKEQQITVRMPYNDVEIGAVFSLPVDDVVQTISDPVFREYAEYCMTNGQTITVDDYWYEEASVDYLGETKKTLRAKITPKEYTSPKWDTDGDGKLSETEAAAVKYIDVSKDALAAIGIEGTVRSIDVDFYFKGVELIRASNQEIETIDANKFPTLKILVCDHCGLKGITLNKCIFLEQLFVEHNLLTGELGIGKNNRLYSLSCWDNNISHVSISGITYREGTDKFFLRMGAQRPAGNVTIREEEDLPTVSKPEGMSDEEFEQYKKTEEYRNEVNKIYGSLTSTMTLNVHNGHWGTITASWCPELKFNRNVGWVGW